MYEYIIVQYIDIQYTCNLRLRLFKKPSVFKRDFEYGVRTTWEFSSARVTKSEDKVGDSVLLCQLELLASSHNEFESQTEYTRK